MAGSLGGHCGTLAPVAAMTSLHFLVSAVITASISSDELPTTSKPCSLRRSLDLPSATAVLTSLASRSTTGCGVLAGASSPNLAAQSMLVRSTKWSWLKAWALKIARHRGMKKAIVALARRLAVIMHRIWVDGTDFRWTREVAAA